MTSIATPREAIGGTRPLDRRVVRRSAALGEVAVGDGSPDFDVFGADPGVDVFATESVAVAFEAAPR